MSGQVHDLREDRFKHDALLPHSGAKGGVGVRATLGARKAWPEGTLMGRCPNCGVVGKLGAGHNKPKSGGGHGVCTVDAAASQ